MIGNVITKKDLEIFRGTYNEVMAQETVNMKIYLAWDTQEIYIGNTVGQKIQYGVSKTIYRRVDERYQELMEQMHKDVAEGIKNQVDSVVPGLVEQRMEAAHQEIKDEIFKAINELKITIGEHIGSYEYKVDTLDGRVTQHIKDVKNEIKDVRDRLNLLAPGVGNEFHLDFGHDGELDLDFGDDSEEEEPNG